MSFMSKGQGPLISQVPIRPGSNISFHDGKLGSGSELRKIRGSSAIFPHHLLVWMQFLPSFMNLSTFTLTLLTVIFPLQSNLTVTLIETCISHVLLPFFSKKDYFLNELNFDFFYDFKQKV